MTTLTPATPTKAIAHIEPKTASGQLADIILGGQDGLVNTLGVILGVAAASSDPRIVIAGGLAATFAEAISMGAVAYTSTLAERDHYLSQLARERREIKEMPEAERQEVREIFENWGLSGDVLEGAVTQATADPERWVDVMMQNELKLQPVDSGNALRASFIVGLSALIGSFVPLTPFLFLQGNIGLATTLALIVSALTLFAVGAYKARITVGKPARSGLQMAVIGIVSALAGYAIGALFGAPAGG
jgi:VIT1/CCC1 family predicted Fe2+/Mn2+ transporter